jgi:hypothetical protein
VEDCIQTRLSERCGGGPLKHNQKKTRPYR